MENKTNVRDGVEGFAAGKARRRIKVFFFGSGVFDKGAYQGISEAAAAPFSCNYA